MGGLCSRPELTFKGYTQKWTGLILKLFNSEFDFSAPRPVSPLLPARLQPSQSPHRTEVSRCSNTGLQGLAEDQRWLSGQPLERGFEEVPEQTCGGGRGSPGQSPGEQAERDKGRGQPGDSRDEGLFRMEKLPSECRTKKSLENVASPFSGWWFRWKPNS